jgi:hypothetical protein
VRISQARALNSGVRFQQGQHVGAFVGGQFAVEEGVEIFRGRAGARGVAHVGFLHLILLMTGRSSAPATGAGLVRREMLFQGLPGPGQAAHDGPHRHAQDAGHIGVAAFLDIHQGDDLALADGQARDGPAHPLDGLAAGVVLLRPGFLGMDGFIQLRYIHEIPPRAQVVAPAVVQNGKQPAFQGLLVAQLIAPGQGLGQGVLHQVVRQRGIVAPGIGQAVQAGAQGLQPATGGEVQQGKQVAHQAGRSA